MCRKGSCLSCFAYLLLDLGILACLLAFCAPFWVQYKGLQLGNLFEKTNSLINKGDTPLSEGLWGECFSNRQCNWFWDNDYKWEKNRNDWQKATQGLYAGGVILIIVSMLISTFHMCCCCCSESYSIRSALGSLILSAVFCIAASLTVFGAFSYKDGLLDNSYDFSWGFYVGIGGVASCFLAAVFFFIDGCGRSHDGYRMTRVV